MNELELKYHMILQPVYEKVMGPRQHGWDRYTCEELDVDFEGLKIHLVHVYNEDLDNKCTKCIRLPLPIDPVNPERGLWGMLDWDQYEPLVDLEGNMAIAGVTGLNFEPPTLALLKALCVQYELEVTP